MTTRYKFERTIDQNFALQIVDSVDGARRSEMLAERSEYREIFRNFA